MLNPGAMPLAILLSPVGAKAQATQTIDCVACICASDLAGFGVTMRGTACDSKTCKVLF